MTIQVLWLIDRCPSRTHAKVEAMTLIMTSRCVNWGSVALLTNTQGKTCWLRICFWKPEAYDWGVWNCLSWLLQAQNGCWNSCLVAPCCTSGLKWQSQLPAKLVPQHLLQMFNQSQLGADDGWCWAVYGCLLCQAFNRKSFSYQVPRNHQSQSLSDWLKWILTQQKNILSAVNLQIAVSASTWRFRIDLQHHEDLHEMTGKLTIQQA